MSRTRTTAWSVAGVAAAAAAGVGVRAGIRGRQRRQSVDVALDGTALGTLRARARTVVASDGVPLHVEVDEADSDITLVFIHGYCLNLDCWHFQRAAYRGLVRSVFYDQRSHGRSGRSHASGTTIDQLGQDLLDVIHAVVPEGPIVLVGHSMGGMTIIALAEQHPELFGDRIVGVGLISTTAGGLDPAKLLLPMVPMRLSRPLSNSAVKTLAVGHKAVDGARRLGRNLAVAMTDLFAFGDDVPPEFVGFVDEMLSGTSFSVIADFFPTFRTLDKFDALGPLENVPTTIICGTGDRLTSVGHSRKLESRIPGSVLIECPGAGHMVVMERHGQVNAALDQLIASASRTRA